MANSSVQPFNLKLTIDSSAIFSNLKIQILKEINKIRHVTDSVAVNISDELDLVLEDLKETLDEHSAEIMELIANECEKNSVKLVNIRVP